MHKAQRGPAACPLSHSWSLSHLRQGLWLSGHRGRRVPTLVWAKGRCCKKDVLLSGWSLGEEQVTFSWSSLPLWQVERSQQARGKQHNRPHAPAHTEEHLPCVDSSLMFSGIPGLGYVLSDSASHWSFLAFLLSLPPSLPTPNDFKPERFRVTDDTPSSGRLGGGFTCASF